TRLALPSLGPVLTAREELGVLAVGQTPLDARRQDPAPALVLDEQGGREHFAHGRETALDRGSVQRQQIQVMRHDPAEVALALGVRDEQDAAFHSKAFIWRTAVSSPTNTARETIAWPMLTSSSPARSRTRWMFT